MQSVIIPKIDRQKDLEHCPDNVWTEYSTSNMLYLHMFSEFLKEYESLEKQLYKVNLCKSHALLSKYEKDLELMQKFCTDQDKINLIKQSHQQFLGIHKSLSLQFKSKFLQDVNPDTYTPDGLSQKPPQNPSVVPSPIPVEPGTNP